MANSKRVQFTPKRPTHVIPPGPYCGVTVETSEGLAFYDYFCPYYSKPMIDRDVVTRIKPPYVGHCAFMQKEHGILRTANKICGINLNAIEPMEI